MSRMSIKVDAGAPEPHDTLALAELRIGDKVDAVIAFVRCPRAELPAKENPAGAGGTVSLTGVGAAVRASPLTNGLRTPVVPVPVGRGWQPRLHGVKPRHPPGFPPPAYETFLRRPW